MRSRVKRRRRKGWFFVAACLAGLAGALLCLKEPLPLGAAPAARTIQVWPDRSLGLASGLWEPSAVPTPTQVLPLGVSHNADGDVVRGRTYLHFPQDVFPPRTEILHATLYMYVDSTAGNEPRWSMVGCCSWRRDGAGSELGMATPGRSLGRAGRCAWRSLGGRGRHTCLLTTPRRNRHASPASGLGATDPGA